MNKILKIILASLGACNEIMGMFIPIGVALLWISVFGITTFGSYVLLGVGSLATLFRGVKIWIK